MKRFKIQLTENFILAFVGFNHIQKKMIFKLGLVLTQLLENYSLRIITLKLMGVCAAEPRSYHIAGGIPVEKELAIHT
jgi:hypothetical protein